MTVLVAVCTYAMDWLSVCCLLLQKVSERSSTKVGQLVPLLLSFPCFKASHFFFKIAYALNQRKLRLLCGEDFFLKVYDSPVASGNIVDVLQSLRQIKRSLDRAEPHNQFSGHVVSPKQ